MIEPEHVYAGTMPAEKNVEMFVQGVLSDSRSVLENSVAHNIQLGTYVDSRLPFLFPYTQFKDKGDGKKLLIFEKLFGKSLDECQDNDDWKHEYSLLKEENLVMPCGDNFWHK